MKKAFIVSCFIVLIPSTFILAETLNPTEIAKKAFPSVVMLVMQDQNNQPLSLGSGFVVKDNIVATNLHVVEGSVGGYAKLVGEKTKYPIKGYVAIDYRMDLILLEIEGIQAPSMRLNNSTVPEIGEEVFAIGNPKGLEGTFSMGIISGVRSFESDKILQITAPISPGSSGGPVMNSKGNVIGVAVATFKGGQNLNFAIPVSYLTHLISKIKDTTLLGTHSEKSDIGKSILSSYGNLNKDGLICDNFLWNDNDDNFMRNRGFSFSIRNNTKSSVKDVIVLIIFHDKDNKPVEFTFAKYEGFIPSNLAKQVEGSVGHNVKKLTTKHVIKNLMFEDQPFTKIEYRVLHFNVVDEDNDLF